MKNLAKTLIAGTAIAILLPLSASADELNSKPTPNTARVLNGQINVVDVWNELDVEGSKIGGDAVVVGGAVGNSVDVTTDNDTFVETNQMVSNANIGSQVKANFDTVYGSVGITNNSICNQASVSTDPAITSVKNKQECFAKDPMAFTSANVRNVGGDVSIAASAVSNTFSADSNAPNMPVTNIQLNTSAVNAITSAKVHNVVGNVGVSSVAMGNNAQVIHYSTEASQ